MKILLLCLASFFATQAGFAAKSDLKNQSIEIQVTEKGFEPSSIDVKPGSSITLVVTRKTDSTCATEIQVPSKKIKKSLPLNQAVKIDLGKLDKGEIRFGCGMNMVSGKIFVR